MSNNFAPSLKNPPENILSHILLINSVKNVLTHSSNEYENKVLPLRSCSDLRRAQNACPTNRDWARTVSERLLWCTGQQWLAAGQGLWVQQTRIELPEITQDLRNRLLEGTNRALCTTGPRRKEQWPQNRLTQTYPWVSRGLWKRLGSEVAGCRVGGTKCSMGHFEGGHHYLHYRHRSLASGQATVKELSPAHQQKIGLKIYGTWPCPSEQDPVSP